jgi:hypothetical protein
MIEYHKKQHLDFLRERLVRVKRDDVWGGDHEGPYTPGEKTAELVRLKAEIAKEEVGAHSRSFNTSSKPSTVA